MSIQDCRDIILRKASWLSSRRDVNEKVRCIEALAEFGDFEELPLIFNCLSNDHVVIREKALDAVRSFWKKAEAIHAEEHCFRGLNVEKELLDRFRVDFEIDVYLILIRIASLNRSGYVRESSVNELARLPNQENLRFILLRLGDWVPQVRVAALNALRAHLVPKYVKWILEALPLIDQQLSVQRVNLTPIHQEIVQFILEHASTEDVNGLENAKRLRYYKYLFQFQFLDIDEKVAARIFGDSNFLIRFLVVSQISKFSIPFQRRLVRLALKDRATLVKMKALDTVRHFLPDLSDDVQTLLLDKANSVRDFSRRLLKPIGMDFIGFYRHNVEVEESVSGAVMGLCDIGGSDDLAVFEKYAISTNGRVSADCLLALNKFDHQSAIKYAIEMLGHKSGIVRKVSIRILATQATQETLDWVRARFRQGDLRIKMASLSVFKKAGGWSVLPDLINSVSDDSAMVSKLGWQLLAKFRIDLARLFVQPTEEDLERARQSLKQVGLAYKGEIGYWQDLLLKDLAFFIR
jgi:HEAT repeat protein